MTTKDMDKKKTGDEKPLTAVVIVETFETRLSPLLSDGTSWVSCWEECTGRHDCF
jgi:hypothetical protein